MGNTRKGALVGRRELLVGGVGGLLLAACGGSGGRQATTPPGEGLVAQVASYELVAGRDQRFIVGLFSNERGTVSFGEVALHFSFLGAAGAQGEPRAGPTAVAGFLPIPGQEPTTDTAGPRYAPGAEARGVYGAETVRFDEPGFWQVEVAAELDGRIERATAAFQVGDRTHVPAPGDPAPHTDNPLLGDPDLPPAAIDSRAGPDGRVPDPELHATTVADAIAARRPVMVVVSTPVFCVSRFCGPITDAVQALARRHGEAMDFVHIEVWRDFASQQLNDAAAEWIWPDRRGDPAEPWVFLVGPDGTITKRWDNVVTAASLAQAAETMIGE
jgi:hypothetical protein